MRVFLGIVALLLVAALGIGLAACRSALDPIAPPARMVFESALVQKGEALAALGSCAICHSKPGGAPFAGGRALPTPFGTLYSTNITPDAETGIGQWSEAAFFRAMREGIDRAGRHLYPAFPYDHFTKVADDDLKALYAFLMSRPPVKAPAEANDLRFPFNNRPLLAGWNLLFLDRAPFTPDPARDAVWNRGAYLVQGLGHCGACHTPRNALGAEKKDQPFAGGEAEGWHAPALGTASRAPITWTLDSLLNYLIDGWDAHHGVAAGPMTPVVDQFADLPEDEITAIATYLLSLNPAPPADARKQEAIAAAVEMEMVSPYAPSPSSQAETAAGRGELLFSRSCLSCHRRGSPSTPLALTAPLNAPDPRNLLHAVIDGIKPPKGAPERSMPAFAATFSDEELVDLLTFMQSRFSKAPAWTNLAARIREVRESAK